MILNTLVDEFVNINFFLLDKFKFGFHDLFSSVQQNRLKLIFIHVFHGLMSKTILDNDLVKFQLDCLSFNDSLLYAISADQPIDIHLFLLSNSMCSVHSL
jgi:hypothetical protein